MHCKSIITVFLLFSSACYHKWQNWLLIQLQLMAFHKIIFSNFKFGWKSVFGWIYGDLLLTKCLKANLYRFFWIFTHFWTGIKKLLVKQLLVKHYIRLCYGTNLFETVWRALKDNGNSFSTGTYRFLIIQILLNIVCVKEWPVRKTWYGLIYNSEANNSCLLIIFSEWHFYLWTFVKKQLCSLQLNCFDVFLFLTCLSDAKHEMSATYDIVHISAELRT